MTRSAAGPPKLKAATRSQTFSASEKEMPWPRGAAGEGFGVVDMDVAWMWLAAAGSGGSYHTMSTLDPTPLFGGVRVIPVLTIEHIATAVPLARALVAGGSR